jgi:hypothetical protein
VFRCRLSFQVGLYIQSIFLINSINDPSAGSPTKTLLRLLLLLNCKIRTNFYNMTGPKNNHHASLTLDITNTLSTVQGPYHKIQSVGATGGVYKEQGLIQGALMRHPYKAFLVHVR